jgi:hypothetical protein
MRVEVNRLTCTPPRPPINSPPDDSASAWYSALHPAGKLLVDGNDELKNVQLRPLRFHGLLQINLQVKTLNTRTNADAT